MNVNLSQTIRPVTKIGMIPVKKRQNKVEEIFLLSHLFFDVSNCIFDFFSVFSFCSRIRKLSESHTAHIANEERSIALKLPYNILGTQENRKSGRKLDPSNWNFFPHLRLARKIHCLRGMLIFLLGVHINI